jgi:hypothetical protein
MYHCQRTAYKKPEIRSVLISQLGNPWSFAGVKTASAEPPTPYMKSYLRQKASQATTLLDYLNQYTLQGILPQSHRRARWGNINNLGAESKANRSSP